MSSNRQGLRGYVSSRPFGEFNIPVPLQSLGLRDYCQRNNIVYVLPVNENMFPHSYMVLEGMIQNLAEFQGIVMYSMQMLPQRPERRRAIYDKILSQGCSLHIVLESIIINNQDDVEKAEELMMLSQLSARMPKELPVG
jgi:sporadic carbohydrate cluster protein (TIGR04323 family)